MEQMEKRDQSAHRPAGPVAHRDHAVGAPGSDGRNGSDGSPGPPGVVPEAVIEQLRADILKEALKLLPCKGFSINNPATSCKEIHDCDPTAPSGYYWVNTITGTHQIFCSAGVPWVAMLCQAFTYCALFSTTAHHSKLRTRLIYTHCIVNR